MEAMTASSSILSRLVSQRQKTTMHRLLDPPLLTFEPNTECCSTYPRTGIVFRRVSVVWCSDPPQT
eukprot:3190662-Amphidinium_carterae.1